MLPLFEPSDNREHLFIMDVVIDLGRAKLSRVVCDRVQAVVFANLGEDGAERVVAGVGLDNRRLIRQKVSEDWRLTELSFQMLEGLLALRCPFAAAILLRQVCDRNCDLGETV